MPGPMFAVVLGVTVLVLAAAELLSCLKWSRRVSLRFRIDRTLTEPGEAAALTYRIGNTAFWPLPSVSVTFTFENAVVLLDEAGQPKPGKSLDLNTCLLPHQFLRGRISLAIRERGLCRLGRVYVESSDLLGLRSVVWAQDIPISLVCTAEYLEELEESDFLGGFQGDISVKRFILEDPSLVLGFREYTGYEPMKQIAWSQTARAGQLMVKKHDYTTDMDVTVLVDMEACRKPAAERCLSMARTVCDLLVQQRVPFRLLSNGDLYVDRQGSSRLHNHEIQRRIGLSRFVRYRNFDRLLNQCAADNRRRGYIVILPRMEPELEEGLRRLRASTDTELRILTAEEDGRHA